jgi:hypothetical protein
VSGASDQVMVREAHPSVMVAYLKTFVDERQPAPRCATFRRQEARLLLAKLMAKTV